MVKVSPRLTAAVPVENPCCSCRLTRVRPSQPCGATEASGDVAVYLRYLGAAASVTASYTLQLLKPHGRSVEPGGPTASSAFFNSNMLTHPARARAARRRWRPAPSRRISSARTLRGCVTPQHGLSSNKMALIPSDCGAMRSPSIEWPCSPRIVVQCAPRALNGPNHLGLRCDALPEHRMALITSGSAPLQGTNTIADRMTVLQEIQQDDTLLVSVRSPAGTPNQHTTAWVFCMSGCDLTFSSGGDGVGGGAQPGGRHGHSRHAGRGGRSAGGGGAVVRRAALARRGTSFAFPWPFTGLSTAFIFRCLLLPFSASFTDLSLTFHCLSTAFRCLPLSFSVFFTAFPWPFTAFPLPFRCLSLALSLPFRCLFVTSYCLSLALSLPFTDLSTGLAGQRVHQGAGGWARQGALRAPAEGVLL